MRPVNALLLLALICFVKPLISVAQPVIISVTPYSGPVGASIKITGNNFGGTKEDNIVFFGAARADITAASSTELTVTVPKSATYAPLTVLNKENRLSAYATRPFNVTFPSDGRIGLSSFDTAINFHVFTPTFVAMGDFDGDGKIDMASTSTFNNQLTIYRNTAVTGLIDSTSFTLQTAYTNTTTPSIAVGDLDGDGRLDLVVPNPSMGVVTILKNLSTPGKIVFSDRIEVNTGLHPYRAALGDLDKDGRLDIALVNYEDSVVSILRNVEMYGYINKYSFGQRIDLRVDQPQNSIAIGDLDGDGRPEIITGRDWVSFDQKTVTVFKNISIPGTLTTTSFKEKVGIKGSYLTNTISIGDLDGDGKPEIATSGSEATVYKNMVQGDEYTDSSFVAFTYTTSRISAGGNHISIGDLDGDNRPDLVIANSGGLNGGYPTVVVLHNTVTAARLNATSFAETTDFRADITPEAVAIGDLDGDGKPDLAVPNQASLDLSVLKNRMNMVANLCAGGGTILSTLIQSDTYQWQINNGNGFINMNEDDHFSGTNTARLQLQNIPSSWDGYQFRCIAGTKTSDISLLKFGNEWTGAVNTEWETPDNWSCGQLPDSHTEVTIQNGSVILNSTTSVKSIKISPAATLKITAGHVLNVMH